MKNRMDVPNEYEPVLPRKVKAHIEKKKAQDTDKNALLTQIALAVGNVIGQLKLENPTSLETFDVRDLSPEQFQELKFACMNHLSHLIPDIEKETTH
ncbi:MAG: hypothetical protein OXL96_27200 [Candidatus Poribacteria bacterium]|nr:hypothetical protein [Candidatus Poribacteria bacterium]